MIGLLLGITDPGDELACCWGGLVWAGTGTGIFSPGIGDPRNNCLAERPSRRAVFAER